MGIWDSYNERLKAHGSTKRQAVFNREVRMLNNKVKDSLSFHSVQIDGVPRQVTIINSDNLDEKKMISLPGEDFTCGGMVEWADNHWLITEKDANTELYTRVKLEQCNYLLKWIDSEHKLHEQWCIISDGTKLKCVILDNNTQRFGILETICKNYFLNCWNPLRALLPKQSGEQSQMATV